MKRVPQSKGLPASLPNYSAAEIPQIEAEIVEQGHSWMEAN